MTPDGVRLALKNSYFRALDGARVDRIIRTIRARRGDLLVLNLHRVSPHPNPYWPPLTPGAFESLIAYLGSTCEVTTFAQLRRGRANHRPQVVLSFDDGCQDFVEYAMPILDRHRVRVNFNVIVESVETGRPPWSIALMDALGAASTTRVRTLRVPGFPHRLARHDDRAKVRFGTLLARHLKALPKTERVACHVVNALLEETNSASLTPMMSVQEIDASAEVHELGSHSYSHESMGFMTGAEFRAEIDRCEDFFSSLRRPMKIFAFPNDSYRKDQIAFLQARGVNHVLVAAEHASNTVLGVHPRITIYGDTASELRLRAMGWVPPLGASCRSELIAER